MLTVSCSQFSESRRTYFPQELNTLTVINLPFQPLKTAYSPFDKTLFLIEPDTNLIHIYQEGRLINKIGGLGFGADNFNRLSDIAVSPHGQLLALDSFQKQIKQFDSKGKWMENHSLSGVQEPVLFDIGRDGVLYVYDKALNEVIIFNERLTEVLHRFGKFYFIEPEYIISNLTAVTVYDKNHNKTFIFDNYGKLDAELKGYWQIDRYNNRYRLAEGRIIVREGSEERLLTLTPADSYIIKDNYLHLIARNRVQLTELIYRASHYDK